MTIRSNGQDIGGLFSFEGAKPAEVSSSQWVPILVVPDALQSAQNSLKLGAKLVTNPLKTSDGTFATITDPSGAYVTLYDGALGVDPELANQAGNWHWADLLTSDTNSAKRFYKSLVGFDVARKGNETEFTINGEQAAGLVRVDKSEIDPNWLPYVAVSNLEASLALVSENGGALLARNDEAAIIIDPTGAGIGMIQVGGQ